MPGRALSNAPSCSQAWLQHPEQTQPGLGTDSRICRGFVGLRLLCTAGETIKACSLCHNMAHQLQAPPTQTAFAMMDGNTLNNLFPRSFYTGIFNFFTYCQLPFQNQTHKWPKATTHQHSFIFDESLKPTCDDRSIKSEMLSIRALCVST